MNEPLILWWYPRILLASAEQSPQPGAVPYMLARPQSIETAPKDGTWVLGWDGQRGGWHPMRWAAPATSKKPDLWFDSLTMPKWPTLWLPLPPAPESDRQDEPR